MSILLLLRVAFPLASRIGSARGNTSKKSEVGKERPAISFFFFFCLSFLLVRSPWVGCVPGLKATLPVKQPSAYRFPLQASEMVLTPGSFGALLLLDLTLPPLDFLTFSHVQSLY